MPELPRLTGSQAIKAFKKDGFECDRIKGSHHILKKPGHKYILSIPVHKGKTLGAGLLSSLISSAGMTVEKFREYL